MNDAWATGGASGRHVACRQLNDGSGGSWGHGAGPGRDTPRRWIVLVPWSPPRRSAAVSSSSPHAAEDVAREVLEHAVTGVYVEANPMSPDRTLRIDAACRERGGTMVDGSIIAPERTAPRGSLRAATARLSARRPRCSRAPRARRPLDAGAGATVLRRWAADKDRFDLPWRRPSPSPRPTTRADVRFRHVATSFTPSPRCRESATGARRRYVRETLTITVPGATIPAPPCLRKHPHRPSSGHEFRPRRAGRCLRKHSVPVGGVREERQDGLDAQGVDSRRLETVEVETAQGPCLAPALSTPRPTRAGDRTAPHAHTLPGAR